VSLVQKVLTIILILISLAACQRADFHDAEGNGYRYSDLEGKWLIINYWATWCGPCIKEIPELNEISGRHPDKLNVFGVDFDGPNPEEMQASILKMGIEFPVFRFDPALELGLERPEVLPTTFVLTPGGTLHATLVGPQTEGSLLKILEAGP
tara:strand:+ start:10881 stop:11336 length:456 start_codon:yes stop_codon:yes gene_type:complete